LIVKTEFPFAIRKIDNTWIPLADGCRLAASIWLPEGAEKSPVPAILEYLPYRKDDSRAVRDSSYHPYFAGHGYASIRVDIRGTGASDGILMDEYLPQEQDDALEVLAWIADQALVHRRGWHHRHLLGRVQRVADRRPPAAPIEGRHQRLFHRRPLR
jgi:predicted acyl esterase